MRNMKKLERIIALALVLGSCTCSVSEAYQDSIYGNSPTAPTDFTSPPTVDGINVSGYELDFHYNSIDMAFGGYAINADALSNTLRFNSGDANNVYAGFVSGGNAPEDIFNGAGNAVGNILKFNGGTVEYLYGGYVGGTGNVNNNKVEINGGNVEYEIFGGSASDGNADSNVVTINEGSFSANVVGGSASDGNSTNNVVNIKANMNDSVVVGGEARDGNADNNIVNIMAGADNITWVCAGNVYKSYGVDTITEYTSNSNKIVVNTDGSINEGLCGGRIINYNTSYKTLLRDNEIIINRGNITDGIAASYTQIDSCKATNESYIKALNNAVIFNDGDVSSIGVVDIYDECYDLGHSVGSYVTNAIPIVISGNNVTINGGHVNTVSGISGNHLTPSNVTMENNSVNIRGGIVQGDVYGGGLVLGSTSIVNSQNNTVNWYGGDINGSIYGYMYYVFADNQVSDPILLDNSTFNFYASRTNGNYNKRIQNLFGFKNYNFYLDNSVQASDILIHLGYGVDLSNSNIGVAVLGSSPLQEGDSVTLLDATDSDGSIGTSSNLSNDTSHMTAENISTVYDFTLRNEDNKKLIATVSRAGGNPKSENLMAVRSAEAFMTYDKVDVVDKAYQASKHTSEPTSFIEYGYSDVTTKDDTKLRGSNVLWGIASTIGGEKDQANTLTRGLFFEYGDGTFSSIGHYPTGSIYGYGKSKKLGLGVLLRKVMFDRHYYDAYLRAGTIKTDYDAFADGVGNITYENSDMYVSGNLGYGQFIQLTPNLQMDTYIKYFYNRIPGHSTTAYTNGIEAMPISFDVFENHRFRLGSKFTWDYMESNNYKWYADVALEQEFAKDQSGSINSHRISKSNGSSTTGVIELCYENKFGANNAFMFTAKAQGYVGDRRGLGASANLSFSF